MTGFDDDFFHRTASRAHALRAVLPQEALEGLAREVVTRLAQRSGGARVPDPAHPGFAEIEALCTALVSEDPDVSRRMMLKLQASGLTLDTLYAEYLAPAAARLGALWDDDRISFVGVTLGVGRIVELVRVLRDSLPPPKITRREPVLFATVPGDQHSLGVGMAAELFRQHGWDVRLVTGASHDEIMNAITDVACLVLGLSAGGPSTANALARLIHAVRVAHPEIFIILSGQIVTKDPGLVDLLQPDSAVSTVEDALATMDMLLAQPARG